jgi:glycosyltransferase involved in cell wall biosynthesis
VTPALPRVIHLASAREWRGGQRQVLLLATALARLGVDQLVVTNRGSRLAIALAEARVPVDPVEWRGGLSAAPLLAAVRAARLTPALLHAHDSHALVLASIASRLARRTPVVATRRTDYPLRRGGFWVRANRVIAISTAVREALLAGGVSAERLALVPDGIDLNATEATAAGSVRRELGLPEAGPLAVQVGALTPDKDQATLIRGAARLQRTVPGLHWAIAGAGPLRDSLEALVRDEGVGSIIHLVGQLEDPLRLIAAADVFVMSSAHEGLGTSILDAMALGRPIVATAAGGIPDLLGRGAGLLVPVGSADALSEAVARVLAEPNLGASLSAAARADVVRFSDVGMATGVRQVYRSLALER